MDVWEKEDNTVLATLPSLARCGNIHNFLESVQLCSFFDEPAVHSA